jgi:hypothetical protein
MDKNADKVFSCVHCSKMTYDEDDVMIKGEYYTCCIKHLSHGHVVIDDSHVSLIDHEYVPHILFNELTNHCGKDSHHEAIAEFRNYPHVEYLIAHNGVKKSFKTVVYNPNVLKLVNNPPQPPPNWGPAVQEIL